MGNFYNKKKGELTTQQLVGIIVLIVSFAILLIFLFSLNLGETTKKEICHNSVLLKEKSVLGGSLDCKTTYVCISGGGNCGGNYDIKKEIDLGDTEKAKNEIMKAIADEMADCWGMFGEGKIDYVGLNVKGATIGNVNCGLCSVIAFDETINNSELEITYNNFYKEYLKNSKTVGKSYLIYLYGTDDISNFNFDYEDFDFTKKYSVITGIGKLGVLKSTANWFASGFDAFNAFLAITPKFKDYGYIQVTIKEQDKISELNCDKFLTKA